MTDVPLRQARIRRIDPFAAIGAIPVAVVTLVILSLLGTVLAQSFIPQDGKGSGLTLSNFVGVFSDPQTFHVLLNSLGFSTLSAGQVSQTLHGPAT